MDAQKAYASVLEIQFQFAQSPIMPRDKHRAYIENLEESLRTIENEQEFLAMGLKVASTAEELQISYDDTLCLLIQMREIEAMWPSPPSHVPVQTPAIQPKPPTTTIKSEPVVRTTSPAQETKKPDSFLYDHLSQMPGYRDELIKQRIQALQGPDEKSLYHRESGQGLESSIVLWSMITIKVSDLFIFPRTSTLLLNDLNPKYFPPAPGILASYFNARVDPALKSRMLSEAPNEPVYLHTICTYFMHLPTAVSPSGRREKEERRERKRMVMYAKALYYRNSEWWSDILASFNTYSSAEHPFLVVLLTEVGQRGLGKLMEVMTNIVNNENISPASRALAEHYRTNIRDLLRYYPENAPRTLYKLIHYRPEIIEKIMANLVGANAHVSELDSDDLTYLHSLDLI